MSWFLDIERSLGFLANILQIATVVLAGIVVWRARRKLNNLLSTISPQESGTREVAIAIGIDGGIGNQVEGYFQAQGINMPVHTVDRSRRISKRQGLGIVREVNHLKQQLTDAGVTKVHLFYKGPVTIAMAVGAIMDNWVPVIAYDFHDGTYSPGVPLGKGTAFDIGSEMLDEGEEAVVDQVLGQ